MKVFSFWIYYDTNQMEFSTRDFEDEREWHQPWEWKKQNTKLEENYMFLEAKDVKCHDDKPSILLKLGGNKLIFYRNFMEKGESKMWTHWSMKLTNIAKQLGGTYKRGGNLEMESEIFQLTENK